MSSCMKLHKQPQPFPKAGVKRSPSITQAGTEKEIEYKSFLELVMAFLRADLARKRKYAFWGVRAELILSRDIASLDCCADILYLGRNIHICLFNKPFVGEGHGVVPKVSITHGPSYPIPRDS